MPHHHVRTEPGRGGAPPSQTVICDWGAVDFAPKGERPHTTDDAVVLADDSGPLPFRLGERLRADARAAIDALRVQGVTVLIASGDGTPRSSGRRRPYVRWRAGQLPADKLAWLSTSRADGRA